MNRKRLLSFVMLAVVVVIIPTVVFCKLNRISSWSDWTTRNAASKLPHPVIKALNSGKLSTNTTVPELLRVSPPTEAADFGRLRYFWFRQDPVTCQAVIFVDDQLVTLVVIEQDFSWTFFGDPDPKLVEAMSTVRLIRDKMKADPSLKDSLQTELALAVATLGLSPDAPLPPDNNIAAG
jgi:hypothetical protein